jgi:predicted transcriptional regulator
MLNTTISLLGPLEQSVMECFWASGPQTSGQILATLRLKRTIAHSTVTTTLARLHNDDLLTRESIRAGRRRSTWRYTAHYASRGAMLAGAVEQLCVQLGADRGDRALALAVLLGRPRYSENVGE